MTDAMTTERQYFDLNIEEVLEHWPVAFAVREIIANALDEQAITGTVEPAIEKTGEHTWQIKDSGRGLRYQHLTQKEDAQKRGHDNVIGQFGMGLKDALAVFHRRGVDVQILSPHGDITTVIRTKEGFFDIQTLHAAVEPPSDPQRPGTTVILDGCHDLDVENAKQFFLHYSDDRILEETSYGQVLEHASKWGPAHIYVKGVLVAREENFLFSYNITSLTKPLQQALNRERSNVGRSAYTDRVKIILKQCVSAEVARPLANDLINYASGEIHDELLWKEVTEHACRILATHEMVVFVTVSQLQCDGAQLNYARADGYRLVLVPEDIAHRLSDLTNLDGEPIMDLDRYREAWNASFAFEFVDLAALDSMEASVFALTKSVVDAIDLDPVEYGVRDILISETMRLNKFGDSVQGLFEPDEGRIVIRRDVLKGAAGYCGILLHELAHAVSGERDGTLAFENALTRQLGILAVAMIDGLQEEKSSDYPR
jgi:hypothetical protein